MPRSRKFTVLHLFSGPADRRDGLAAYLKAVGISCVEADIVNVHLNDQDILDDSVWARILGDIKAGKYDFVFAGPPCRTFSEARNERPGPPVLRNQEFPYGFPKSQARSELLPSHYEQIRADNLLAERTAEACAAMHDLGRPYGVEQPAPFNGAVTMFQFKSFEALLARGAEVVHFDQCMHGAPTKKPTTILYAFCDFSSVVAFCNHPSVLQTDKHGNEYYAPHPSYVGKKNSDGSYATGALAAYPAKLNCRLATVINSALVGSGGTS